MLSSERSDFSVGLLSAAVAALAGAQAAHAATASTSLLVSTTVETVCTVAANPLSFGTYRPGLGNVTGSTTLSVRCPKGAHFTVALDAGTGGPTVLQRSMTFGPYKLQYNLYTAAARATVWGDGTLSSATVSGVGHGLATGRAIVQTVYGQVPDVVANQEIVPGVYTDTIRVTVTY